MVSANHASSNSALLATGSVNQYTLTVDIAAYRNDSI